jgi:hypothetical protein
MNVNYVSQIEFESLYETKFDFIICSSGFESRSVYSYQKLTEIQISSQNKICFSFQERKKISKTKNDFFFKENDFRFIDIESNEILYFTNIYYKLFEEFTKDSITIYFDYSCMTSIIYGALLKYFKECNTKKNIDIYFSYTHAMFTEATKSNPLFFNHPIPLFDPVQSTDKKVALLIGLGYEEDKALGLFEYFQNDSEDLYLFVTNNNQFYNEVVKSNTHILNIANKQNIINYDLENIPPLINTLDSLVNYLINDNYRVVIAPVGPKVFNLLALIINLYHKDVTTYRLSDGNKGIPVDKIADNDKAPTIIQLNMMNDK